MDPDSKAGSESSLSHYNVCGSISMFESGLWIRIRIHFISWIRIRIQYADPDPGGKIFLIKTEKGKEIANNCNLIQFLK